MNVVSGIMMVFALLGAADRIFGGRLGLGREFEKGFMLLGPLALSMIGMIVISPVLADLIAPALDWLHGALGIDPSVITSSLFANDMGGGPLAREVAADPMLGRFNGMVVASMMGVTVSFTIPFALNAVKSDRHEPMLLGLMCGVVAIPVGCFAGGLAQSIPLRALIIDMLPLTLLSAALAAGLLLAPGKCVRVFSVLGKGIQALITAGLGLGILKFLTGREIIPGMGSIEEGAQICVSAAVIMSGAFPLLKIAAKALEKPMAALCSATGLEQASAMGLLANLASSISVFEMTSEMDRKGVMLNSAFAVSAAFVLGDHLAFTMAYDPEFLPGMMIGKLTAGVLALALAALLYTRLSRKNMKI